MTVHLKDDDPRAVRIRSVLFNEAAEDPVSALWIEARDEHREILAALAVAGEMSQMEIEKLLRVKAVALRGVLGGLAKIAKRLGVEYPLRSVGTYRPARRFSLKRDFAEQILKLSRKKKP